MKRQGLLLLLLCVAPWCYAQQGELPYRDQIFVDHLKTIQLQSNDKERSLPVITLGGTSTLQFSFDDLQGGSKRYRYSIQHCSADWRPSNLSPLVFSSGFADDLIDDYQYASATLQKYTHYKLTLPNERVKMKISGNYLLTIYDDAAPTKALITQRFYVTSNQVQVIPEVKPNADVSTRPTHQKIDLTLHTGQLRVQSPLLDIKTRVMQNANPLTTQVPGRPSFVSASQIAYKDIQSNLFEGGNEFRRLDLRRQSNAPVSIHDENRNKPRYSTQPDEDGRFFIGNINDRDKNTESDYVEVDLELKSAQPQVKGTVYIVGQFNQYRLDPDNALTYHAASSSYTSRLLLKQGVYDYQYVWKPDQKNATMTPFEGSYYETRNSYQVLVYYRKPAGRWDELVGYFNIQTDTAPAGQ